MERGQRRQTIAIVEAVRAAVGPDIELMLDVHGRLNVPTAIAMTRELARFDLAWIEEPTPPESIDALADVRAKSPVPIAAGERWFEPDRFLEAIEKRAVDILQPDVCHLGGMFETKKVAGLAHTRYLPVAPHNPTGPVMNAMTLHLAAAIPNFLDLRDGVDRRAVAKRTGPRDAPLRRRRPPRADGARPRRRAQRGGLREVPVRALRRADLLGRHDIARRGAGRADDRARARSCRLAHAAPLA